MKTFNMTFVLCALLFSTSIFGQNCGYYMPLKQNSGVEMKSFNAKDKPTGSVIQKITTVSEAGGYTVAKIQAENFNEKGKSIGQNIYDVKCNGTSVLIDSKMLLDPKSMESYKDMEMKFTSGDIEVPSNLAVNSTMKDASMAMTVVNNGVTFSEMNIKLLNRKVVSKETITVPAGTFECFKVTYDVAIDMKTMGFPIAIKTKGAEYISAKIGTVKSESYDANGKLVGYNVLSKIL